jgi:hypothetical protein
MWRRGSVISRVNRGSNQGTPRLLVTLKNKIKRFFQRNVDFKHLPFLTLFYTVDLGIVVLHVPHKVQHSNM